MPRGCRICKFFDKPYRQNEKRIFEKLVREGKSLRKLETFFEALSVKANKDTIARHIRHMNLDVSTQRRIEKQLKKEKTSKGIRRIGKRVKELFIRPTEVIEECPHTVCIPFYDIASEQVYPMCRKCGKILGRGRDPHESENKRRNLEIYRRLRRGKS